MRIEQIDSFVYLDVMVICDIPQYHNNRKDTICNPTVIIEVLSLSMRNFDRGGKFRHYRTFPPLQEYVLIEQDFSSVEVFRRREGISWLLMPYDDLEDSIILESLGIKIQMKEIYRKVVLGRTTKEGKYFCHTLKGQSGHEGTHALSWMHSCPEFASHLPQLPQKQSPNFLHILINIFHLPSRSIHSF